MSVGLHGGVRNGFLSQGEFTEMHLDAGLKVWKFAVGYSRLWLDTRLETDAADLRHDATGNALRLSFAPLPPVSLDLMLGSATGSLTRTLRNVPPSMMTSTSEAEVSQRAIGITLVPWGTGIWNVGLRADYTAWSSTASRDGGRPSS